MNESLQPELIRDEQISGVVRSISLAIQVDPFVVAMTPDEQRRASFVKWLIPRLVGYGQRWGNVFCPEDGSGGAIWLAPGNTTMGFTQMARGGLLAMPLKVGLRGIPRLLRTMSITEGFHKRAVQGPHWYLIMLGVDPERQGQGLGTALVEAGAAKANADGVPCYLETATEENVSFFSKRGFEVVEQAPLSDTATAWSMVRQPR